MNLPPYTNSSSSKLQDVVRAQFDLLIRKSRKVVESVYAAATEQPENKVSSLLCHATE
jgi:hypothetical protein